MVPSVYTLTGNLLAERTFVFAEWTPGRTQRARASEFQVGGKGINVAKMLARLSVDVQALCFTGGATGQECETWLARQAFRSRTFAAEQDTRLGLVVRSANQRETTFLGPDAPAGASAWRACGAALDSFPDQSVLALAGSFPGWDEPEAAPLREALARWCRRGILYVDTYGPPLEWALTQPVQVIKINRDELDLLRPHDRGQPLVDRVRAQAAATGIGTWIVTDGPEPVCFAQKDGLVGSATPPRITEVSATGSGDVFLASLIHAKEIERSPLALSVQKALAYGAANAAHPGVAEFDLNQVPFFRS